MTARRVRRTADTRSAVSEPSTGDTYQCDATDYQKADSQGLTMRYEPNPKHKEPWQRGARGSLCPLDADAPALLAASELDPEHPGKRYAPDGVRAYCGHEHSPGCWHGFPIEWRAVPQRSATHGWKTVA